MKMLCVGLKGVDVKGDPRVSVENVSDMDTAVNLARKCFNNEDKAPYTVIVIGGNVSSLPETRDILLLNEKSVQNEIYSQLKNASPSSDVVILNITNRKE